MDELDVKFKKHFKNITGHCRMAEREGVYCDIFTNCDKCGWNWFVEEKRKEKIRKQFQKRCP